MHTHTFAPRLCTAALLLAALGQTSASPVQRQLEQQLESAQQQLQRLTSPADSGLKELTRNCVAVPISTTPNGPTWTFEVQTAVGDRLRGTAWRQPCDGNDGQLILTLQPLQGTPFVCGSELQIVIGAARTDDLFLDVNPNDGVGTSFCTNLASTTSFVIYEFDNGFSFDDDGAFTLVYESDIAADASVAIPAFDPSLYAASSTGSSVISGKLSGSYYAASRNGEGVQVEVGSVGARRVLFLTWYTYFQGQQRWLVGSVDLASGATQATVPLFLTSGGQFGAAYDPTQISVSAWGSANVQFTGCTGMRFQWSQTSGASGSYDYVRGMDGLEGIRCP